MCGRNILSTNIHKHFWATNQLVYPYEDKFYSVTCPVHLLVRHACMGIYKVV